MKSQTILSLISCLLFAVSYSADQRMVIEPAHTIPVTYDVDVVVVGGASGGVAAAVEAASNGASVFLAAPRPYLGEDMCATYRLWLEEGEEPATELARKLFKQPAATEISKGVGFTYRADLPSAPLHRDSESSPKLTDGQWTGAPSQSVQYDGDVTVDIDLGQLRQVRAVHVLAFQRNDDFEVDRVRISANTDNATWQPVAAMRNDKLGLGAFEENPLILSADVEVTARYLRCQCTKGANAKRILLGEIIVEDAESSKADTARPVPYMITPMQVKRTLDEALLDAGVQFLFGSYATDVLTDEAGNVAGIVMSNRSGRQAVKAKVVIDGTPRAAVARMAGATFRDYPEGLRTFKRIVLAEQLDQDATNARRLAVRIAARPGQARNFNAFEHTLAIPVNDNSFAALARAEQIARDQTFAVSQADASEILFQVPADRVRAVRTAGGAWPGADRIDLDVLRPGGVQRLYVLGGCADVSREAVEAMVRPIEYMKLGARLGKQAARESRNLGEAVHVRPLVRPGDARVAGHIAEVLTDIYPRRNVLETVRHAAHAVPVLAEYDVVIVGGGTGGAPAGIAAARQGARTLVIEYLHGLGGVGTLGLISSYYHGNRVGFTAEVDKGLRQMRPDAISSGGAWNVEVKMEWYRRQLREAGADIWYGVLGSGAFVEGGCVKGVVVATPDGRGVVLAKCVVDATGNAGIAAAAGAECVLTDDTHIAVQGTGLPPRELGASYTNTDYTFIDDSDVTDMWASFVLGREKFKNAYDMGQLIDTRERRQIVGDFCLSPIDIYKRRTFPDTIVVAMSNFDSHGYTVHPAFYIRPPDREGMVANVPYRCLLPKGLDGILVTGLGVSAHRDAMPVIRMQPDVQNQGYAAGVAAAMVARDNLTTRALDIKALQRRLIEKGILAERVLTDTDSFPLPASEIAAAIKKVVNEYEDLETILAQPETAIPMLREAWANAETDAHKLAYAHILGILGDGTGADTLIAAVAAAQWDKGWNYTGMGQFGRSLSYLDTLIIALARTGDKRALKPILDKVESLNADLEFSHHRAVAVALETLRDPAAARPLAELLGKPGMTGHANTDMAVMRKEQPASPTDNTTRNVSLRELELARALYKCGDHQGFGKKILSEYEKDYRGYYSRHAHAILNAAR